MSTDPYDQLLIQTATKHPPEYSILDESAWRKMNPSQALCFGILTGFLNKPEVAENIRTPALANLVVNVILMLTASGGNFLINCAILSSQNLQTPSYLLISSLALTDLLVGVVYQPLQISFMVHVLNSNAKSICQILPIYSFVITLLCVLSFLMVAFISIDRNLALTLRQRYRLTVTKRRVLFFIILGWMMCFPFAFSSIFLPYKAHVSTLTCFLGLLLVISCCFYANAYRAVHGHACRRIHPQQPNEGINIMKYRKTLKTMVIVLVCLMLCFAPFICSLVVMVSYGVTFTSLSLAFASLTLMALHSSVNPVIYVISFRDVRCRVKKQILDHICTHWH